MFKAAEVEARPDYRLWIRFSNGVAGEVDLSDLAGNGVFEIWNDYATFENVVIGESGELIWGDEVDLCPDSLYVRLSGKSPEDLFPNLREMSINA